MHHSLVAGTQSPGAIRLGTAGVGVRHRSGGAAENHELTAMAQNLLAEMLHDQGQDLEAARAGEARAAIDPVK